jgi:hypothetical protein
MSGPGLFVVGVLVTLIVAAALALLVYAAVLDGRYAKAHAPNLEPREPAAVPDAIGVTSAGRPTPA